MRYNYRNAVKRDLQWELRGDFGERLAEVLRNGREELAAQCYRDYLESDAITGKGSGAYTWRERAEEYLAGNQELLTEAAEEQGIGAEALAALTPEARDVVIRCHVFEEVYDKAIVELDGRLNRKRMGGR